MSYHKVIIGDSRLMSEVKDESVHLIIISPLDEKEKDIERLRPAKKIVCPLAGIIGVSKQ